MKNRFLLFFLLLPLFTFGQTYNGQPWKGDPAVMPGSTLMGWEYDWAGDTLSFANDSGIVCGIIDIANGDAGGGNPRNYGDAIPKAGLKWNFGRQTYRGNGQWARYTIQILYPGYYHVKARTAVEYTGTMKFVVEDMDLNQKSALETSDVVNDFIEGEQTNSGGNTRWMTSKDSLWLDHGVQVIYIENTGTQANGNFGEFELILTDFAASSTYMGMPFFINDGGFSVPYDTIPSAFFDKGDSGVAYGFVMQGAYESGDWRKQDPSNSYYWNDAGVIKTRFGVNEETGNTRYGTMKYDNGFKLRYTINVVYPGEYYNLFRVHANAFRNYTFRVYKINDMNNPIVEGLNINPKAYTPGGGDGTFEKNPYSPEVLKVKVWDSIPMVLPKSFSELSYSVKSYSTNMDAGPTTLGYASSGGVSVTRWNTKINFDEAGLYVVEWDFANGGSGALSSFGDFYFVPADDSEAPTAPTNIMTVDSTQDMVMIAWDPSTDNFGVVTYELWMDGELLMKTGSKTMATLDGLDCGSVLDLEVRAVDQNGNFTATNYTAYNHICQGPWDSNNVPVLPGTIQAEFFDIGGQGIAYWDDTPGHLGNEFRNNEAVDIAFDKGELGIGWVRDGEWLEYTIDSIEPGKYNFSVRSSGPNNDGGGGGIYLSLGEPTEGTNMQLIDSIFWQAKTGWVNPTLFENIAVVSFDAYERVVMRIEMNDTTPSSPDIFNIYEMKFEKIEDTDDPLEPDTVVLADAYHTWLQVSWPEGTDANGVKGYNIYVDDVMAGFTNDTTFVVEGLDCDSSYIIKVQSVDFYDKVSAEMVVDTFSTWACQKIYPNRVGAYASDSIWIEFEYFDLGGNMIAYNDNTPDTYTNGGFKLRVDSATVTADLHPEGQRDTDPRGDNNSIGWTGAVEWFEYTIDTVINKGFYNVTARTARGGTGPGGSLAVFETDGPFGDPAPDQEPAGKIPVNRTGGWNTYADMTGSVVFEGGTNKVIRVAMADGCISNLNWIYFEHVTDTAAPVMGALTQDVKLPDSLVVSWPDAIEDVYVHYYLIDFDGNMVKTRETSIGFGGLPSETVYTIRVKAVDAEGKESDWVTLEVETAGSQFTYVERIIEANPDTTIVFFAEEFDNGGLNSAYFDDANRVGNALDFRPFELVDLQYNADSSSIYVVDVRNGEYLEYTFKSIADGLYDVKFHINQLTNGRVVMLMGDGPLGENLVVLDTFNVEGPTGGFNTVTTESWWFDNAEDKVFRFEFLDADSLLEFDWFSFTYVPDTVKPDKPVLTVVEAAEGHIRLSWDPSMDNVMAPGYGVKYQVSLNGTLTTTTDTTILFAGLLCETEYDIIVRAIDAAGNSIETPIKVSTAVCPPQEAYPGVDHQIPGMIDLALYDLGGLNRAYFDKDGKRGDLSFRPTDIVDVVVSNDTVDQYTGYDLSFVKPGEWLEYTLSNVKAGTYNIEVRQATIFTYGSYVIKLITGTDTATLATINSVRTPSFLEYDNAIAEDIQLTAADQAILRVEFISSRTTDLGNINFIKFVETTALNRATANSLRVYPNPSNSGFNVDLSAVSGAATLEIFDLSGRMVYNQVESGGAVSFINPSVFNHSGIYLLKVKSESGTSVARLIVE